MSKCFRGQKGCGPSTVTHELAGLGNGSQFLWASFSEAGGFQMMFSETFAGMRSQDGLDDEDGSDDLASL